MHAYELLLVKIEKKLPNWPKNTFNNHVVLGALYGSDSHKASKTIRFVCKNAHLCLIGQSFFNMINAHQRRRM